MGVAGALEQLGLELEVGVLGPGRQGEARGLRRDGGGVRKEVLGQSLGVFEDVCIFGLLGEVAQQSSAQTGDVGAFVVMRCDSDGIEPGPLELGDVVGVGRLEGVVDHIGGESNGVEDLVDHLHIGLGGEAFEVLKQGAAIEDTGVH